MQISASLAIHLADLPERCSGAKLAPLPSASREELQAAWGAWMQAATDAQGRVPSGNLPEGRAAWTSRKSKGKPELRLTAGKGLADLTRPLSRLLEDVVKSNRVVAFVKGTRTVPECGFSRSLLSVLEECCPGEYEVVNCLDTVYNPGLREAIKEFSAWPTLPQLYVAGEFLGGSDLAMELHAKGELKAKLLGG